MRGRGLDHRRADAIATTLGIVDLLSLPRAGDPHLSPDGRDLLFTRGDADWKTGRRVAHFTARRGDSGFA